MTMFSPHKYPLADYTAFTGFPQGTKENIGNNLTDKRKCWRKKQGKIGMTQCTVLEIELIKTCISETGSRYKEKLLM